MEQSKILFNRNLKSKRKVIVSTKQIFSYKRKLKIKLNDFYLQINLRNIQNENQSHPQIGLTTIIILQRYSFY